MGSRRSKDKALRPSADIASTCVVTRNFGGSAPRTRFAKRITYAPRTRNAEPPVEPRRLLPTENVEPLTESASFPIEEELLPIEEELLPTESAEPPKSLPIESAEPPKSLPVEEESPLTESAEPPESLPIKEESPLTESAEPLPSESV